MNLEEILPTLKTGEESFMLDNNKLNIKLKEFWSWSCSNLIENRTRGILAEFIVSKALGIKLETRTEWDDWDITTSDGRKIEVKCAAYIQTWAQKKLSNIVFDIAPNNRREGKRMSDMYIFCLLNEKNQNKINPLDLNQWDFFTLPTKILDLRMPKQKTLGLHTLLELNPIVCTYLELNDVVNNYL